VSFRTRPGTGAFYRVSGSGKWHNACGWSDAFYPPQSTGRTVAHFPQREHVAPV